MKAAKLTAQGRVQGVGYRKYIETKATHLQLNGYVKNLTNGDVEIWVEGFESAILDLIDQARRGSLFANVKNIHVEWATPSYTFDKFSITER